MTMSDYPEVTIPSEGEIVRAGEVPSACCKCAAYREILAAQAQEIARMKNHLRSALDHFKYAQNDVERADGVRP